MAGAVEPAETHRRRQGLLDALRGNLDELIHADVNLAPDPLLDPGPDEADDFGGDPRDAADASSAGNLKFGPLTIWPGRYQIEIGGHPVDLTPTEFDLLLYLAAQRGRVISCRELVSEVRGHDMDEARARNLIRPHVSKLRRKLRQRGERVQMIENVRGAGYQLRAAGQAASRVGRA